MCTGQISGIFYYQEDILYFLHFSDMIGLNVLCADRLASYSIGKV